MLNDTFITPMQRINGIDFQLTKDSPVENQESMGNIFKDVLQSVIDTDKTVAEDLTALATGEIDDLHTLTIDQTKAQLSIKLLVELRNKVLDAYSEIMRTNL